ncbi:outer membrane beta-barrel protein [Mucilaginibacter psychrotolerans]|uniref:Outer membrane protein beta-barrel domain-containing protein n=1 Tax=Mucilaginibacter psychrotolerans TaxID=1524096 RepID=A0A4Y8RXI5_9SPHI|nr:outer membrane beta-barrel protein [Mucilaginibacter psychrotolerans]TFF30396.1 hypothetical protein E2R66_27450 [Mucilaginibacter psychrotolerans]
MGKRFAIILLVNVCIFFNCYSQEAKLFSLTGKVKDVELNYFLNAATVSLFSGDSTLISFQITDSYGVFNFNKLKPSLPYHIIISNVDYRTKTIEIKPNKHTDVLDLGVIIMEAKSIGLAEVFIGVEPVTMNGDTLEFNSGAFKLDSNAVLDDWLRKIPNVTVWNDGQITVNGREIKSLLVNGKRFFGNDFKVATQNLPKNIIQTIQVYKKEQNRLNPLDSLLEMNIKLKKGMETGFFGKVSFGRGTNGRYEGEGNMNAYSRKIQISIAGASNNTNKIANDLQTLLANSTFKSSGTDLSYQSNFQLPGNNKTNTLGLKLNYDFVEFPTLRNKSSLSINHFYQKKVTNENAIIDAITTREAKDPIFQKSIEDLDRAKTSNSTAVNFDYLKDANAIYVQGSLTNSSYDLNSQNQISSTNSLGEALSSSRDEYAESSTISQFSLFSKYNYTPSTFDSPTKKKKFVPFSVSYANDFRSKNSFSNLKTAFTSNIDGSVTSFDRNRQFEDKHLDQQVELKVDDVPQLLFGKRRYFLNANIVSNIRIERVNRTDLVQDNQNNVYVNNSYSSNRIQTDVINSTYGINFSKVIVKRLSDRYEKSLIFQLGGAFNTIKYDNNSLKEFQNLRRNYFAFIPDASISLANHIFGKRKNDLVMSTKVSINIPQIEQLAPLLDSTQFYYFRIGNLNLSAERVQHIGLSYSFENLETKNSFSYQIDGSIKFSNNKIIDSILLSPDGRQQIYAVNGHSYRSLNGSLEVRKAIKYSASDLKLQGFGNITKDFIPAFINSQSVVNENLIINIGVGAGYGFRELMTLDFRENLSFYRAEQPYFKSSFKGTTLTHTLSLNYKINKKLFFNTNINVNDNRSSGVKSNVFNIWNAYLSQRFLKGNNVELKFSALDILKQNKNLINRIEGNRFITNSRNALQQYFLFAISYYPRNFVKRKP